MAGGWYSAVWFRVTAPKDGASCVELTEKHAMVGLVKLLSRARRRLKWVPYTFCPKASSPGV